MNKQTKPIKPKPKPTKPTRTIKKNSISGGMDYTTFVSLFPGISSMF